MAESNKIFELITPFINQVQEIEYMLDDLRKKRWLSNAEGMQLDGIGEIVGIERNGLNDYDYKLAILRQILFNISCGQPETLVEYFELISGHDIIYKEEGIATVSIKLYTLPSPLSLLTQINSIKPIGVQLIFTVIREDGFTFADEDGHVTHGYGFLEDGYPEGPYTAGHLAENLTIY